MASLSEVLAPVKAVLPEEAKDLKLNLGSVIERSKLSVEEATGAALAAAIMARSADLVEAFEAADELPAQEVTGARTAAALMAMNTTWYPFPNASQNAFIRYSGWMIPWKSLNRLNSWGRITGPQAAGSLVAMSRSSCCHS